MQKWFGIFLISFILILSDSYLELAGAREMKGVNFPETVTIQDTPCKLNGIGVRKKIIIDVYLGALYLPQQTTSASQVITSDQVKRILLHFVYREVKKDQLIDAWNEGFKKNGGASLANLQEKISRFNSFFTESVKKGEIVEITYIPGKGTEVIIKGQVKGVIEGKNFMEALFSVWFGEYPPTQELKKGMLGLS
jgi:hypothetical protein